MTDRDITETIKLDCGIAALDKVIAKKMSNFAAWADKAKEDPHYHLRWAMDTFKDAAALHTYKGLRQSFAELQERGRTEMHVSEVTKLCSDAAIRMMRSGFGRSSSPLSNLMEYCEAEVLAGSSCFDHMWIFEAQRADPEYQADYQRRMEEARKEREIQEALELKRKRDAAAERRRNRVKA